MEIVSVINYKGGVGKTTVTANLAAIPGDVVTA
jgi:cellulose biosynthesis protein BcsQ